MNIYKISKSEYKNYVKKFKSGFYGKNLYSVSLVMLCVSCIFMFVSGFNFGYNDLKFTNFSLTCLIIGTILMGITYIIITLINIEIRKYIESKNK